MTIVERSIQHVRPGKWDALEEIDKRFDAAERRLGFPHERRLRCYSGGHDTNTLIIEYEWESMAAMEAAYERAMADPELQALGAELDSIIDSDQVELYALLP
jgi:hypothetical protein